MTGPIKIWTYDWVPDEPRGFVRDLRLRWACEEMGLPYEVGTVPFDGRETNHLDRQPFGQVPFLDDGDLRLFESGAGLLHLARKSDLLMPSGRVEAAQVEQWIIAALNSIEMVTMPWVVLTWSGQQSDAIEGWLDKRLGQIEAVLSEREYLVGDGFTAADLLMADVLRLDLLRAHGARPASEAYVGRMLSRPAFKKALADQLAHFAAADEMRKEETAR
tara:strand:- start:914 stop:1567 length:654 start_codon:yes stop_codon:yes gene_type:complete